MPNDDTYVFPFNWDAEDPDRVAGLRRELAERATAPRVSKTLVGLVESYKGLEKLPMSTAPLPDFGRALRGLFLLLLMNRAEKPSPDEAFLTSLSSSERHALELLEEWWYGRIGDSLTEDWIKPFVISLAVATFVEPLQRSEETGDESFLRGHELEAIAPAADQDLVHLMRHLVHGPRLCTCSHYHAPIIRHPLHDPSLLEQFIQRSYRVYTDTTDPDISKNAYNPTVSAYHDSMGGLYYAHGGTDTSVDTAGLRQMIREASIVAAATRIGQLCWRSNNLDGRDDRGRSEHRRTEGSAFMNMTHFLPTFNEPCSWLKEEELEFEGVREMPYYLWDIEGERCCESSQLDPSTTAYAIVSYTWGRWRKLGNGVSIPSVPWRVPENERFDVKEFPGIFKRLGFRERYIWVDILCIPQQSMFEDLSDELAVICQREIARQAVIFQHATTAVAWIHDIEDWSDLQWNLEYMALSALGNSLSSDGYEKAQIDAIDDYLTQFTYRSPRYSGLGVLQSKNQDDSVPGPSTWLTSLWTLQETMIRPDLLLVNKSWEPLMIGSGIPGRIGDLVALYNLLCRGLWRRQMQSHDNHPPEPSWDPAQVQPGVRSLNSLPPGPRALISVLDESGLASLGDDDPLIALIMGGTRFCEHSRAEAIMSVTGATKWHLDRPVEQFRTAKGREQSAAGNLVCGLYPFEFVVEVYERVGASFFNGLQEMSTLLGTKEPARGSMMLFRTIQSADGTFEVNRARGGGNVGESDMVDHPAVVDWKIQRDGSVKIPKAGIVASKYSSVQADDGTSYSLPPEANFMIGGNNPERPDDSETLLVTRASLNEWLRHCRGEAAWRGLNIW
ncbi:hypothetical protein N0V82_006145 [Gnomoniopsis sp. IMI 355080]|nr:hypothetical protein N0V82_006145 [Gnomoniopsis sp. IMI 355080]